MRPGLRSSRSGFHRIAYRWMLDQVIDINENSTTYSYTLEKNRYRDHTGTTVEYDSAVYPDTIYYGEQSSALTVDRAPAQVEFKLVGRCIDANVDNPFTETSECPSGGAKSTPGQYPDVPADLICTGTCSSTQDTPSFFAQKRLLKVVSRYWNADNNSYSSIWSTQSVPCRSRQSAMVRSRSLRARIKYDREPLSRCAAMEGTYPSFSIDA